MERQGAGLRLWLQERQYATAYHWAYRRNNRLEYQLRTRTVLELLGLAGAPGGAAAGSSRPRPRLLDVGCGDARFLGDAASLAESYGVDVSSRALGFASDLVPSARFSACHADALCFPDATFDLVTLLDVIEHVPDHREQRVLDEVSRVLRPGGRLVISTNTDNSAVEWKHFRHYSIARFRDLFYGRYEDVRLVGLIPYFPTLRLWMQAPLVWRWFSRRVQTCSPNDAQIVLGVGTRR